MAGLFPTYNPDIEELPFALKLAQFLLGASHSLGDFNQNMAQQSKMAASAIDDNERSLDRKSLLAQRQLEADNLQESREWARDDRRETAATKAGLAKEKADSSAADNAFLAALARLGDPNAALTEIGPQADKLSQGTRTPLFAALTKQPKVPSVHTRNPEHDLVVDGQVTERGTPSSTPKPPTSEGTLRTAAIASLKKKGQNWEDEEVLATEMEALREGRGIARNAAMGQNAAVAPLLPASNFPGVQGAQPGETIIGMKERVQSQVPKPEGVEERAKRISTETTRDIAGDLEAMLKDPAYNQYMGSNYGVSAENRLKGREFLGKQGPGVPDKLAKLNAAIASLQNRLSVALNSARATEQDFERTLREVPRLNDLPNQALQKLTVSLKNLEYWEARAAAATGRGSAVTPGSATKAAPKKITLPNGTTVEVYE